MTRMDRQFEFLCELDKEKEVFRQTYLADATRKENDAEHAWHMAVMALVLQEYAPEGTDLLRVISMILLHDVVEIYAGDTFAYDKEAAATQKRRELEAADRIFAMLPPDQEMLFRALWDEFEAQETPEAKFARTLDNVQPAMLNHASGGRSWREKNVCLSQIMERNRFTGHGAPALWAFSRDHFILPNVDRGNIRPD